MAKIQPIYKDISTDFNIHPITGDLVLLTDADAVKNSIQNLLLTDPFERFFYPNLSGGVKAILFENIGPDTEYFMKQKITEVIKNYEPRANLISVKVKAYPDQNAFDVTVTFSINNNINPVTFNVILRRVR